MLGAWRKMLLGADTPSRPYQLPVSAVLDLPLVSLRGFGPLISASRKLRVDLTTLQTEVGAGATHS